MRNTPTLALLALLALFPVARASAQDVGYDPCPTPGGESAAASTGELPATPDGAAGALSFPTITYQRMTKSVPSSLCASVPTATTSFASTDAAAYLYFRISGFQNGEGLSVIWWDPSGQIYHRGSWAPLSTSQYTYYCLEAHISIAGTSAASKPGTWRVQVFSDKVFDVPYVDLTFTVTSSGGTGFPTITNARTTKAVPANYGCTPLPTATSSFSTTDAKVYLWFQISGHADGERLSRVWYSPDGKVHATGQWDPLPAGSTLCRWASLDIAGASAASKPGTWRVQVFSDRIFDVPYVDKTFTITAGGGGGFTVAGTWLLTSSARVQGGGAFWKTDLSIRNKGTSAASVIVKFLGQSSDGRGGPERSVSVPAGQTVTWRDVLSSLFGLTNDFGPILVRASTANLAILGQTWTAGGAGTYGQSVPVLSTDELIGSTPKSILGVRQDTFFRTNLMLANATESTAAVTVQLVSTAGAVLKTLNVSLGPLSRAQYNVGGDFGYPNLSDAVFVISSPTAGARIGAYASVIDAGTADPRTLLPR